MITAVDTSVLIDILAGDSTFGPRSAGVLRRCLGEGSLVACEVVWAEVAGTYDDFESVAQDLTRLGVDFSPIGREAAVSAGIAWREYRMRRGERGRVLADFLVGAHARVHADRLLTRDRGFYRGYFEGLEILDPSARVNSPRPSPGS